MARNSEQIGNELKTLVKGDVLPDIFNRIAFSTDASIYQILPVCIVAVRDVDDIIAVIKYSGDNNIPIVARGAGSGLAGESLTDGIVINTSRYFNSIIESNNDGSVVICQPGVVLDDLNKYLARFGKKIGPDPSSSNRACIGGIAANNATGAHSLEYGYIADHLKSIKTVLADGNVVTFTNNCKPDLAEVVKRCISELKDKQEVIAKVLAKTSNRCGYNIADICHDNRIDMARLMAGSEGTLGIFTEIELCTVDVPKAKAILHLEFGSSDQMAAAVPIIVQSGASTCELMDKTLINMAVKALPQYRDIFPTDCAATLLVEHTGPSIDEVRNKIEQTDSAVGSLACGRSRIFNIREQDRLWKSRKDATPLLNRERGPAHSVGFIEDISVDNTKLAEYISALKTIGQRHHILMAFYGHAGDGRLHIRPYLDLSTPEGIKKMRQIANDAFELAWSLGGSISGEHADGLVRAGFVKRQYGDEYYELLKAIKNIFDPDGLINPGKIINDDPDIMVKNLRASNTVFADRLMTNLNLDPKEFRFEIEQCNGDGACLSTQPGARMCPVFRALGEELASSRAKANLLRAWTTGIINKQDFKSEKFKEILGLCINCRMCSVECPSDVDISKLIIEVRAEYARRKGLAPIEQLLSHSRIISIIGSMFSPISNLFMDMSWFKTILEKTIGLDHRRSFPKFQRRSFIKKGRKFLYRMGHLQKPLDRVAYFVDSYANYNDHELGFAVIKFLRLCNIEVILPRQVPAPIPAIVYGDLKTARKDLNYSLGYLVSAVRSGYKIICSEPSAALCLKDDLKLLFDGKDAQLVSASVYELMDYLNRLNRLGRLKPQKEIDPVFPGNDYAYHCPCHLCALRIDGASIELLGALMGIKVTDINSGCCGLAGTCGMQNKNYDLSIAIAKEMVEALCKVDTDYVLTECAACKMQIEHLTNKKVLHPIKLLAKAYGII